MYITQRQSLRQKTEIFASSLYTREPLAWRKSVRISSFWGKQSIRPPTGCNDPGGCPGPHILKLADQYDLPVVLCSFPLRTRSKAPGGACIGDYSSQLCQTFCTSSFRGRSPRWGNWKPVANQAVFNFALLQRCCFFVYVCHSPFDWLYNNYTRKWVKSKAILLCF